MRLCSVVLFVLLARSSTSAFDDVRYKRSFTNIIEFGKLAMKGAMARKELLFGTKRVTNFPSQGFNGAKHYRYTKPGGWTQARQDFYAVDPSNVAQGKMGQIHVGTVGDRTVELTHQGPFDFPTIRIYSTRIRDPNSALVTEEIIYVPTP